MNQVPEGIARWLEQERPTGQATEVVLSASASGRQPQLKQAALSGRAADFE